MLRRELERHLEEIGEPPPKEDSIEFRFITSSDQQEEWRQNHTYLLNLETHSEKPVLELTWEADESSHRSKNDSDFTSGPSREGTPSLIPDHG